MVKNLQFVVVAAILAVLTVALSVIGTNQVFAPTCENCAKAFAPGQLAKNSESHPNSFAAGHQIPPGPPIRAGDGASDFAPGIVKESPT
jgi:hypothetical protein